MYRLIENMQREHIYDIHDLLLIRCTWYFVANKAVRYIAIWHTETDGLKEEW